MEQIDLVKAARVKNKKPWIILILSIIASFFLVAGSKAPAEEPTKLEQIISNPEKHSKIAVLVVGIDRDRYFARSDTIMLAFIDPRELTVRVLSIPRDTRVEIAGRGYNKINAAFAIGGVPMLKEVISDLTGVKIDYHVATNLQGFINLVDLIGGVEIDVKRDMYYIDKADGLAIDIKAGKQRLDGLNAMHYVRYRDPIQADIGRIERQQKFMRAMISQALSFTTLTRIPALARNAYQNVDTDFTLNEILELGTRFFRFHKPDVKFSTAPGVAEYINRVAYYLVDVEAVRDIAGKTAEVEQEDNVKEDSEVSTNANEEDIFEDPVD